MFTSRTWWVLAMTLVASCGGASSGKPAATNEAPPATAAPPTPSPAPAPAAALSEATPPRRYSFVTLGRIAGTAEITVGTDGTLQSHFAYNDRGRGADINTTLTLGPDGAPVAVRSTGHDYWGAPVDEVVDVECTELVWHSPKEHGRAPRTSGFFLPDSGPVDSSAVLARALAAAPGKRLAILPAGEAWIEDESTLDVQLEGKPRHLRRVAIGGLGYSPGLIWLDEHGDYFAEVSPWSSVISAGAEELVRTLVAEDAKWVAARSARLAGKLVTSPPAAGLVFQHARLFDSEKRTIKVDQTVVCVGDEIVAVGGPKTKIPAGAQVIDAHGRTLIPGLWDMHVHLGDDDGALDLAIGVTTVRDLGNDADDLAARKARFDAGTEVGPRVLRAGLIDGPGEFAAPIGVLVSTEDEARAAVKKFADMGYQQIKIYSSVAPALVPFIAKEAHARGLRVSGHVPQGMIAEQAINAGYDEVQHANMLFLNFLIQPGEDTRGPARFLLVARGAAGLDLDSPPVKKFFALLLAKKTVLDPTLVTFEDLFTSDPGDLAPAMSPYRGRLPAIVERGSHGGGLAAADAKERATFRASHAAMGRFIKLAWEKGVRIVAGTDGSDGLSMPRELELYVAAGIPAADVLFIATLGAARVMGRDKESGSITVGKQADLVLVDGDPTKDISATRNADVVVCRGRIYDPDELFAAVGMKPRGR